MRIHADISDLIGKTLTVVTQVGADEIYFDADTGERWKMYHEQDCCESVCIEDVAGDLQDLVGSPVVMAECVTSHEPERPEDVGYTPDSQTWTFYKLATAKGYVTLRWYGYSNGYYSESVDFVRAR